MLPQHGRRQTVSGRSGREANRICDAAGPIDRRVLDFHDQRACQRLRIVEGLSHTADGGGGDLRFGQSSQPRFGGALRKHILNQGNEFLTMLDPQGIGAKTGIAAQPFLAAEHDCEAPPKRLGANSNYEMHIDEFRSPDFHGWAQRSFAVILVLVLVAFASNRLSENRASDNRGKLRLSQLLVVLLAAYAGFYSSRNLPVSSMLLVLIAGPILWGNFAALAEKPGAWQWVRNGAARISNFSDRMGAQEMQLCGLLWPVVSVALAFAICLEGGWLGSRQLIHAQFDPKKMPVAAVTFLQEESGGKQPSAEPVFSTDAWGGYLIYKMYPERKVVVDDRHDLYGPDRIRQYLI